MKITKVERLMVDRFCLVRIETDQGVTGIGESGAWPADAAGGDCTRAGDRAVHADVL
jgi:galactonate dehydratase